MSNVSNLLLTPDNRLKVAQTVAPAKNPVSQTEVQNQLNLDADQLSADSSLIDRLIVAATGWAERYLGKQLITATWSNYYNLFTEPMVVWYPPVQSVEKIEYKNDSGNQVTVSSNDYVLDARIDPAEVRLSAGKTWPSNTEDEVSPVEIKVKAGYGDNPEDVPAEIRQAILMKLTQLYENRGIGKEKEMSSAQMLLDLHAVNRL